MTTTRPEVSASRLHGLTSTDKEGRKGALTAETASSSPASWGNDRTTATDAIAPVRKAAIVLVSLEQSLASQLLSHLDRAAVEAVTWEIARLERVNPEERAAVLEEFYGLGLRRLCFVFDDLVKLNDSDIRAAFHDEDIESWALALAGAAAPARAKVLGALSALFAERLQLRARPTGPVPALRRRSSPARDRRKAASVVRPGTHQPTGTKRARRSPRVRTGIGKMPRRYDSREGRDAHASGVMNRGFGEGSPMPRACCRRRNLREGLALTALLAVGLMAGTIVSEQAWAGKAPAAVVEGRQPVVAAAPSSTTAEPEGEPSPSHAESHSQDNGTQPSRSLIPRRLSSNTRSRGSDGWYLGMAGITLALAVCGGLVASARRFFPQGAGTGVQIVSRVNLSPKHTVYLLRIGRRVLLVGAGPQGPPSLITELDDPAESEPSPRQGVEP